MAASIPPRRRSATAATASSEVPPKPGQNHRPVTSGGNGGTGTAGILGLLRQRVPSRASLAPARRSPGSTAIQADQKGLHPLETAPVEVRQFLAVFTLPAAYDRGVDEQPRAFRHFHDAVYHLADGLALDRQPRGR